MIWCCWESIQRSKNYFCFRRLTFVHQLLWWTFFLWIMLRRSNIFRVLGQRRTSYFWHRTFIKWVLEQSKLYIVKILLRSMGRNLPWRNGVLGMESSWQPIFLNQSSINLGNVSSKWLRTWQLRPNGSSHHRLGWSISKFWSKYHKELRYQWPYIHRRFQPINGQTRLRCMVQRRCRILLGMGQLRRSP